MAYMTFADQLMAAKRRARLSGRPLSSQETAGVTEGWASQAADRVAKSKSLALAEEQQNTQKEQWGMSFAEQKNQFGETLAAQKEQFAAQMAQRESEFEKTYGLSLAEAQARREEFLATFGLSVQSAVNQVDQFNKNYALSQQQVTNQNNQYNTTRNDQNYWNQQQLNQANQANKSNKTAGVVGGAATGAMIGSYILPGWGTAIGGVLGGVAGLFI